MRDLSKNIERDPGVQATVIYYNIYPDQDLQTFVSTSSEVVHRSTQSICQTTMSTQQPPQQDSSESESVFTRFRRSLSGSFTQTNAPSSQPSTQKTEDIHSTSRPTTPRQPTTFEKLISLGQSRKDWEVDFPPPHWSDQTGSVLGAPGMVLESSFFSIAIVSPTETAHEPPPTTNPTREANNEPPPEPTTLAKRIQSMLASIPPILPSNSAQEPKLDGEGPPPKLVSDPKMISFLSSPGIMNGSLSKSGQSVWSVLDRLRAQLPGQDKHRTDIPLEERKGEEEVLDDDESGVMIYGPLLPTADSEVELAKSEMVPHDNEESKQDGKKVPVRKETIANKLERMWPFGKEKENDEPSKSRVFFQPVKEKRVWIPSKDKISIQVMWWGYRMFVCHLPLNRRIT